jgi:three-Cys-motif partner protein
MVKRNFSFAYIDAFAGTGYVNKETAGEEELPLFADLVEPEPQSFLSGSVKVALETEPQFTKYLFIEKDIGHCDELKSTCNEYPDLSSRIDIINSDANAFLQDLCENRVWKKHRAVLFLDPYGMQVEWRTIECIAKTEAIDMWLLFPLGMSINRLLTKDGDIPEAWVRKLDMFFGTHDWMEEFYREQIDNTLFGPESRVVKDCSFITISQYFVSRLKSIFPAVAENPLTLCNSRNVPLFLLCFAAGNKKGGPIAKRIAEYILSR